MRLRVELASPGADPFCLLHLEWKKPLRGPGGRGSMRNLKRKKVFPHETLGDDFPCSKQALLLLPREPFARLTEERTRRRRRLTDT